MAQYRFDAVERLLPARKSGTQFLLRARVLSGPVLRQCHTPARSSRVVNSKLGLAKGSEKAGNKDQQGNERANLC